MNIIGLIPARAGSIRVPHKNIRILRGHPLIAYTIAAAKASNVFSAIMVSTDSPEIAEIARSYGAEVPFLRSPNYATATSADIEWIEETLKKLADLGRVYDCFSILRPTSPLRQAATIQRAWQEFQARPEVDSLRAVQKCKEHPGKMWMVWGDGTMKPLLTGDEPIFAYSNKPSTPWHSTPYQALPSVHIQNASLEMAWCKVVLNSHTIAGERILPFFTQGYEGLDINEEKDWWYLEYLLQQGEVQLPLTSSLP